MKHAASPDLSLVDLQKTHSTQGCDITAQNAVSPGDLSEENSALDPHREALEYPARWAHYCKTHFGNDPLLIAAHFQVSEKTGRNWLAATGGVRAIHQNIAFKTHPGTAPQILLGAGYSMAAE
jgi:hypothetical protein